ncbi:MAG: cation:proton antiporter [Campylobacterota bacterium]|nr:cation:proton antiporter [Campylobacterota bacterium]
MLEIIIYTLLVSTILNLLLRRFGIPTIIGYIATGTIIAYHFDLHSTVHSHELKEIAEFGVVFLMFTIGLEFSINHLMKMKKEVFINGALQVFITSALFSFLAHFIFDIEIKSAIIIGAALALSSTAIVLKLLNESGDINKLYGRKVLGILLFQDLAVIPILLMITIFSATDKSISSLFFETFVDASILIIGLLIVGKYMLEPFFHQVTKTKSSEIFISSILLILIGASYIADLLNFSYSLGAFIAGMMIAETHYKHQVEADLIPFRDLLLGIFFITVGMQLDFQIIYENIHIISLLLPALILIKILLIFAIVRYSTDKRTALKSAFSLFQLGEFALVIFELSFAKGLLEPNLGQILIVVVIISMIITPFVLRNITQIVDIFVCKIEHATPKHIEKKHLSNHVVLIGFGRLGKHISKLLQNQGIEYIALESDIKIVKDAQKLNLPIVFGNASQKSILESLHVRDARAVIISIGNSRKLNHICEVINELSINTITIVKVDRFEEQTALEKFKLSHIIVETEKTATAMFDEAMKC